MAALGPDATSDQWTINSVHSANLDGPPEWREKRNTYAPPFIQLRTGHVDQTTTGIVSDRLQQERGHNFTILAITAGPPEQAEEDAKIVTERAYQILRSMAVSITDLPASMTGETVFKLVIGQIRPATFPERDGISYALGYIPIRVETETGI